STIDGKDYRSTYGRGGGDREPDAAASGDDVGLLAKAAPAHLPKFIQELRSATPRIRIAEPTVALVDVDSPSAVARAVDWLSTKAPDHGTYSVAARVKDFGISEDTCVELLMEHWPPAEAKGIEHITFRVQNAYRYGQNAPGIASAEAEFDAVEVDS